MERYHVASTSQAMSHLGAIPHGTAHRRKHSLATAVLWRHASGDDILLVVCTDWVSTCRYLLKHKTVSVDTMLLCLSFIVLAGSCKAKDSVGEHHADLHFKWLVVDNATKKVYSKVLTSSNQWIMLDHFVFLPLCDFHPLLLYLVVWFVVVAVSCLTSTYKLSKTTCQFSKQSKQEP